MTPLEYLDPTPENISKLTQIPELVPPHDPVFDYLLDEAIADRVTVYLAAIPLSMVRPFSPEFQVESHPVGKQMVDALYEEGCHGRHQKIWVYRRGNHFVASDDYVTLASCHRGAPEFVQCWVLGSPHLAGVKDIQGPIQNEDVRKLLGRS